MGGHQLEELMQTITQIPGCCPYICSYLFTLSRTKFEYQGISSYPVMVRDSLMKCNYAYGLALE